MKKRAMKKHIPRNTLYCYKIIRKLKNGRGIEVDYCKNMIYKGTKTIYGGEIMMEEKIPVFKCRYTGITSLDDVCFADDCKCCGIGEPEF